MHTKKFFVHFNQVDHAQKMYFAEMFDLAHRTLEDFCQHKANGWTTWFDNSEWAVPIVNAQCQYHLPIFAGDHLQAQLSVQEIGKSSLTLKTTFSKVGDEGSTESPAKPVAEVVTTHVFVDKKVQAKMQVPQSIREMISCEL